MENNSSGHAIFAGRQFWICFKLLRNVLGWHGILGDRILADFALNSVLNRYLLTGLGMNPDPADSLAKCRHVVATFPKEWISKGLFRSEMLRFATYVFNLGAQTKGGGREFVLECVNLLRFMGFGDESETLKRQRLK